jgi:type VI secretion system protein ImpB
MPESIQHKLDRVRPPRVQITYDVETGGAIQKKELPFVAGIMADLSGKPAEALPSIKERKFVEIDRDNFNEVLDSIAPRLAFQVDNKLAKEGGKTAVELRFHHMDDFSPLNVVKQVESLRKLFESRGRLNDLLAKLDGNDALDAQLLAASKNAEGLKELKAAAAVAGQLTAGTPANGGTNA